MTPTPVVVFGTSEHSFYVGRGVRCFAPGLPDALALTIKNLPPPIDMAWFSMDCKAQAWVSFNPNNGIYNYSANLPKAVIDTLNGSAEYITFGPTKDYYFVKLKSGGWKANLPHGIMSEHQQLRARIGANFDTKLTGIIFGKGTTTIYMFQTEFMYNLDKEVMTGSNLRKTLDEFQKGNEWLLLPGSSLCQWNSHFFFLVFKSKISGNIMTRSNLPETMQTKLTKLHEIADSPEEKLAIQKHQQEHPPQHPSQSAPSQKFQFKSIQVDKGTTWGRIHQTRKDLGQTFNLPPVVDLRPNFESVGIEVYNQGNLSSCTANAICGAWQYAQASVDPEFKPSRLFVYYNERCVEGTVSQDSGANISDGCRSLSSYGVCSETTWPYDENQEPAQPADSAYSEAAGHKIHTPAQISNDNIDNLKDSLAQNKPFIVGIALYSEFMNTTNDGVVPMPGPGSTLQGNHAVLCIGYDDQKGNWIFRNSWGPEWGDGGHFYIPYEYLTVDDHLASDFWNISTDPQEH